MKLLNKKGFTLIELLAVIVILAIVAAVSMTVIVPMINGQANKGAETSVKEINKQIAQACSAAGASEAYGKFETSKYYADKTKATEVTVSECSTTGCYIELDGDAASTFVKNLNISGDMPAHIQMTVANCQVQNDFCFNFTTGQFANLTVKVATDGSVTAKTTTATGTDKWVCE